MGEKMPSDGWQKENTMGRLHGGSWTMFDLGGSGIIFEDSRKVCFNKVYSTNSFIFIATNGVI